MTTPQIDPVLANEWHAVATSDAVTAAKPGWKQVTPVPVELRLGDEQAVAEVVLTQESPAPAPAAGTSGGGP